MLIWLEDTTPWVDPDGTAWGWLDAPLAAPVVVPSPEPEPVVDDPMNALDEVIDLIDKRLAEAKAEMDSLTKQVETLQHVKSLLTRSSIADLLAPTQ